MENYLLIIPFTPSTWSTLLFHFCYPSHWWGGEGVNGGGGDGMGGGGLGCKRKTALEGKNLVCITIYTSMIVSHFLKGDSFCSFLFGFLSAKTLKEFAPRGANAF